MVADGCACIPTCSLVPVDSRSVALVWKGRKGVWEMEEDHTLAAQASGGLSRSDTSDSQFTISTTKPPTQYTPRCSLLPTDHRYPMASPLLRLLWRPTASALQHHAPAVASSSSLLPSFLTSTRRTPPPARSLSSTAVEEATPSGAVDEPLESRYDFLAVCLGRQGTPQPKKK